MNGVQYGDACQSDEVQHLQAEMAGQYQGAERAQTPAVGATVR